ncbi:signal peptidase I [candidate division WWE3 bacterium CG08_land_8_20_14_0_20_41_10]|uniref:Signal peptidase I n=1 Tax=candidate division WWE3 bacterium CG08_land_8_20_14_0_20_41_10 TaxID=1975085 RepID=A0A2H0XDL9_UNCKA|nr:MAG: signal peptidase I [candidate division WWE3 bacterium CG08_land_8_20_14_0_20_41_10]
MPLFNTSTLSISDSNKVEHKKQSQESGKSFFFEMLETLVSSVIVILVIYSTIAFPELVVGSSMEPSFYTGERILVEKLSKHFSPFKRGDVVVLHPPGNDNIDYVKRIVGVSGDVVKIFDCKVYIKNGEESFLYEENYLKTGACTQGGAKIKDGRSFKMEEGSFLVMGDNREHSMDSRTFGLVQKERIIGRVVFKFWPLGKVGFVNSVDSAK